MLYSRDIPFDADEPLMRRVLEQDLHTGRVKVNRFEPNQNLGYRWLITFMGQEEGVTLPVLQVRTRARRFVLSLLLGWSRRL